MNGGDSGTLYAMKVLKKAAIITKPKTTEHTITERQVQSVVHITLFFIFKLDSKVECDMRHFGDKVFCAYHIVYIFL